MSYFLIVRGPLGSGKSTICAALAQKIQGELFSIDKLLDENFLTEEKEDGYISQKSFLKANEITHDTAEKSLKSGTPVIFDGNFYWKSQIENLVQTLPFPHFIFTLKVPLKTCIERDKNREISHGEIAATVVYKKSTEFEFGNSIDATKSLENCVEEILEILPKL
ncbi:AAA family ATPase [bacterium]|jgi:adenylate kinase family enzyme|nr:AAA family ATPase [bacterium]MBT6831477.1 AAA family ATPase [bacterium]MBT6996502.1 AAA family ATPase [bacterium]MBT7772710.1 AAA family ATPase [bacterium]